MAQNVASSAADQLRAEPGGGDPAAVGALGNAWTLGYAFAEIHKAVVADDPYTMMDEVDRGRQALQSLRSSGLADTARLNKMEDLLKGHEIKAAELRSFDLEGSVGAGGVNNPEDVAAVKKQLERLGYSTDNGRLNDAITLFQSATSGSGVLNGDGRVDPNGQTHQWLQAANAPHWEMMTDHPGVDNIDTDGHTWGTDWTTDVIEAAGRNYQAYLDDNPGAAEISVNDVSLRYGGDTPDHSTHETGLDVDVSLPRIDGSAGGYYTDPGHDADATKAQIRAWIAAGATRILYNDPAILDDPEFSGIVKWARDHGHHYHVDIPTQAREN